MENGNSVSQVNILDMKIKAGTIKTIVQALNSITNEGKFKLSRSGINVPLVDPAHVAMLNLNISKDVMEEFEINGSFELGIDFSKLSGILGLAVPEEPVIFHYNSSEDNRILIKFGIINRRMAMIDVQGMVDPNIPDIDFTAKVKINAGNFTKVMKAIEQVSDHYELIANKDGTFKIHGEGDTDQVDVDLKKDVNEELIEFNLSRDKQAKALFSLNYANVILKPAKSDVPVEIQWATDQPSSFRFDIEDGKVRFFYLLAPRIESE